MKITNDHALIQIEGLIFNLKIDGFKLRVKFPGHLHLRQVIQLGVPLKENSMVRGHQAHPRNKVSRDEKSYMESSQKRKETQERVPSGRELRCEVFLNYGSSCFMEGCGYYNEHAVPKTYLHFFVFAEMSEFLSFFSLDSWLEHCSQTKSDHCFRFVSEYELSDVISFLYNVVSPVYLT
ncbi:uncharacterized protein CLUP02_08233 [Colletotrichum lupini]|uniref:Uncharacterized protein n=1 Tax=Colletotrichum lupini TaxID=145971 RepID=A0A9Q8ST65_9PEZI|nr:uncharacterized protein CLUP02_08233 [Colletotrichum lupini]UQC82743.1 hypothetical protein CLUP02_08233 [Colletotrichum lupini]